MITINHVHKNYGKKNLCYQISVWRFKLAVLPL